MRAEIDNEIMPLSIKKVKAIKDTLNKEFGHIITEDDWSNVDLLIFYLNTGRADSLKEALLLVDKQRQTDQITDALETASHYIVSSIDKNTYKLASVMHTCFSNLSEQINSNHRETLVRMEATYSSIENSLENGFNSIGAQLKDGLDNICDAIEAGGREIVKAEQFNSALLSQADKRSDELMRELRYYQKYWAK